MQTVFTIFVTNSTICRTLNTTRTKLNSSGDAVMTNTPNKVFDFWRDFSFPNDSPIACNLMVFSKSSLINTEMINTAHRISSILSNFQTTQCHFEQKETEACT
ncbi:hypothetical protein QL285_074091 [Trifolium repens]|nr:hypothetical protein QL285_074091 [Trifolium repens]